MPRQQLPNGIKRIELSSRKNGRPSVRYEVVVDVGMVDGKRHQSRKRFKTEQEARNHLARAIDQRASGTYVSKRRDTVEDVCEEWLRGRSGIKPTTLRGYEDYLKPVVDAVGHLPCQQLKKAHIDVMLKRLEDGDLPRKDGSNRRPYGTRARRYVLQTLRMVLDNEVQQGHLARNVAKLVDMPALERKDMSVYTAEQAQTLFKATAHHRDGHAWHLALSGLRRAEIAGLKWEHIDFKAQTMKIADTRVSVGGKPQPSSTKTQRSQRVLPIPAPLMSALLQARATQRRERLASTNYTDSGYVVVDERGKPYLPDRLSRSWRRACKEAGLPEIRLHDARHTCATLMHHQGVPIVTIAAWLGHVDASFTMRTYAHHQDGGLLAASQTYSALVTTSSVSYTHLTLPTSRLV